MNPWQDLNYHAETHLSDVFNPYIVIDDQSYYGNHINGIIEQTDKGIGARQSFL